MLSAMWRAHAFPSSKPTNETYSGDVLCDLNFLFWIYRTVKSPISFEGKNSIIGKIISMIFRLTFKSDHKELNRGVVIYRRQ